MQPLPREENVELEQLFRLYDETMGFVPNSLFTMARRPEILRAFSELITQIWRTGTVPVGLKPLVAIVASRAAGCQYCQAHEAVDAKMRGESDAKISQIWNFERSPLYSDAERAPYGSPATPPSCQTPSPRHTSTSSGCIGMKARSSSSSRWSGSSGSSIDGMTRWLPTSRTHPSSTRRGRLAPVGEARASIERSGQATPVCGVTERTLGYVEARVGSSPPTVPSVRTGLCGSRDVIQRQLDGRLPCWCRREIPAASTGRPSQLLEPGPSAVHSVNRKCTSGLPRWLARVIRNVSRPGGRGDRGRRGSPSLAGAHGRGGGSPGRRHAELAIMCVRVATDRHSQEASRTRLMLVPGTLSESWPTSAHPDEHR